MLPFGITAANMVTWTLFLSVQIIGFTVMISKFRADLAIYFEKVNDHDKLLYDQKNGEVRLVSFTALARKKAECEESRQLRCKALEDNIDNVRQDLKESDQDTSKLNHCIILLNKEAGNPCGDML